MVTTNSIKGLFINFSNHPSDTWTEEQITAALLYGDKIIDIPFPAVDPAMNESGLREIADKAAESILALKPAAVMCQGEFGLSFSVIQLLLNAGIPVLYACSERNVYSNGNIKTVKFNFIQFRRFEKIDV